MSVAKIILEQLGGNKFAVMTGAKDFAPGTNDLSFSLPSTPHFVRSGINRVKITLNGSDTYDIEFARARGLKYMVVENHYDIYNDSLRSVFTKVTGLETSLGKIIFVGAEQ